MSTRKKYCLYVTGVMICFIFCLIQQTDRILAEETERNCDIVFALDISGSMKKTDENRTAVEAIKMVIDICDENDRIGMVAYNDTIAYSFSLTNLGSQEHRQQLKDMVDSIEYQGETDIGLGIRQAVEMLGTQEQNREKLVILLSDGKTDLAQSTTGRTLEQSEADLNQAVAQAEKEKIAIHTIGFANEYLEDSDYLTIIAANTQGTTHIAASPLQLNQMINQILSSYKEGENTLTQVIDISGELQEEQIELKKKNTKKVYLNILCTGEIYQLALGNTTGEIQQSQKYAIVKWNEPKETLVKLTFQGSQGAKMILNMIEIKGDEPTPILSLSPTPPVTKIPVIVTSVPVQKEKQTPRIGLVVLVICCLTICSILFIVYLFFRKDKKQKYPQFDGMLLGEFIDLKSKNESISLQWQLKEYPEEGVTLKELFHGADFREDLPELDRLCFYPYKNHQLLLVHCMEGGVFLEEENIFQNKPTQIHVGDTVYISFAENSSELELKYTL